MRRITCLVLGSILVHLTAFAWAAPNVWYEYDTAGRLVRVRYAGGKVITYAYDDAGNLTRRASVGYPDTDGDFLDDRWEQTHFSGLGRDGTLDFDKDGLTDAEEFLAGTNPTQKNSVLEIGNSTRQSNGDLLVQWQSVAGKTYRLQRKARLGDPFWINIPGDITATGPAAAKRIPAPTTATGVFRVILVP